MKRKPRIDPALARALTSLAVALVTLLTQVITSRLQGA